LSCMTNCLMNGGWWRKASFPGSTHELVLVAFS
jgi:hypothetical protein